MWSSNLQKGHGKGMEISGHCPAMMKPDHQLRNKTQNSQVYYENTDNLIYDGKFVDNSGLYWYYTVRRREEGSHKDKALRQEKEEKLLRTPQTMREHQRNKRKGGTLPTTVEEPQIYNQHHRFREGDRLRQNRKKYPEDKYIG